MNRPAFVFMLALTFSALVLPAGVHAQAFGDAAVVATASPIFLLPDASRTPLRTLPVGLSLTILQRQGEWLQVTFDDPQLGRRTGWIEAKAVRIRPAAAEPVTGAPAAPADTPPPTSTQAQRSGQRPPASTALGLRVFGGAALEWMSASRSFDAVTGSDRVTTYGGGLQVTNVWRGLFLEASVARAGLDGERVFAFGDEVFPLGIPVELTLMPVDVVAGWRAPVGRLVPYVGGGMTFYKYEETSDFADTDESVDEWYRGFVVMGGVEIGVARWVHVRADVRYRQVKNVLGLGGVSEFYDEDRLGGFGAGLQLVLGR